VPTEQNQPERMKERRAKKLNCQAEEKVEYKNDLREANPGAATFVLTNFVRKKFILLQLAHSILVLCYFF
jgi:hypothetical protein